MKRSVIFIIVMILTVGLASGTAYKSGFLNSSTKKFQSNIHPVSLLKDKANPDIIIVKVGEYVQFNSNDGKVHDLEMGHGDGYDDNHEHKDTTVGSGNFKANEAYKLQFKRVGIYDFHDHYNPKIHISVIAKN